MKIKFLFIVKAMYFSKPLGITSTFTSNFPISFIIDCHKLLNYEILKDPF